MKALIALVGVFLLGACATGGKVPEDLRGSVATQVPVETMARCIGQAAGAAPVETGGDLVVDATSSALARHYTIRRTKVETVVLIQGASDATRPVVDPAVQCAASLTAPPTTS